MSCGIRVENLKKTYPANLTGKSRNVEAVKAVSFALGQGDIFGLIGPSGCGKSTIVRVLAGLLNQDSGVAELRGRLGFVSQDPYAALSPVMRVEAIIAEPLIFSGAKKNLRDCAEQIREVMAKVHLDYDKYRRRLPSELSGGERQRVAIARALVNDPGALILDEPVSMLDYDVKLEILGILRELASENDYAILLISHDIWFVREICTHIAVMESGMIIEEGTPKEICENPKNELTQKLVLASLDLKRYLDG